MNMGAINKLDYSPSKKINKIYISNNNQAKIDKLAFKRNVKENETHNTKSKEKKIPEKIEKNFRKNQNNQNDIILSFNSFKSIKEGFELNFTEIGQKYFDMPIKCPKIGVIGNKKVGKSFILSKIFSMTNTQSSFRSNDKISIELKEKKNKLNYILFDTQGLDNPILKEQISENYNNEVKNNDINNKSENNANINSNNEIIININKELEEQIVNNKLSQDFINSFTIDYCDIVIVVIGFMKYSEQQMLKYIMEECINIKRIIYLLFTILNH